MKTINLIIQAVCIIGIDLYIFIMPALFGYFKNYQAMWGSIVYGLLGIGLILAYSWKNKK